ncbi:Uncharacterised protein (plasmid) [Tsukamurella tyrosinosolvens]|uniref:Uncharacterized protein n=1 Tax=Tsukamurella tyrosinosolvens TaxID=57704 RepID=A0A1H4UJ69_TSUTY|nr:hypothetical protein SAMN04489793_2924 [Tsukamurella tyrosinosolvens]VEH94270.1 Uncharacterised protein [Tsukamurella tyrosinosolvens]
MTGTRTASGGADAQVLYSSVSARPTDADLAEMLSTTPTLSPINIGGCTRVAAFNGAGGGITVTLAQGRRHGYVKLIWPR